MKELRKGQEEVPSTEAKGAKSQKGQWWAIWDTVQKELDVCRSFSINRTSTNGEETIFKGIQGRSDGRGTNMVARECWDCPRIKDYLGVVSYYLNLLSDVTGI